MVAQLEDKFPRNPEVWLLSHRRMPELDFKMHVFWNLFSFNAEYKIWDFANPLRDKHKRTEVKKTMTQTEVDPDTWGHVYIKGISRKKKKTHNKIKWAKQNIRSLWYLSITKEKHI